MPCDHGLGFHDDEARSPGRPGPGQPGSEPPVRFGEAHAAWSTAFKHLQLMAQGQHLKVQGGA